MECGCGRSPTGKCIGWHTLSEEEYQNELNKLHDKQSNQDDHAIHWVYEGIIVNRDLVDAKLEEIVAHVKANEPGALSYVYCLNEDESMLTIYERYRNNSAVLAHGENMQPYIYIFENAVQVTKFLVFGPVNDEVRELLTGFGAEFQKPLAGFVRN